MRLDSADEINGLIRWMKLDLMKVGDPTAISVIVWLALRASPEPRRCPCSTAELDAKFELKCLDQFILSGRKVEEGKILGIDKVESCRIKSNSCQASDANFAFRLERSWPLDQASETPRKRPGAAANQTMKL